MSKKEDLEERLHRLSTTVGEKYDADVILFSAEIDTATADQLIRIVKNPKRRKNVVLMLTTRGGSPDAAFRMARSLQKYYQKFMLYICGMCKSAGTLVAIGADEIVLSDFGEFGPLDIQLGKKDELFESMSGLNITQALTSLNTRTLDFFREVLIDLKRGSKGQISTKLAAEIAAQVASGAYDQIYSQIDPVQLGDIERAINIASDYGTRIQSKNIKAGTIDKLVSGYSSHNFVIDLKEAKTLFNIVREPDTVEEELGACISSVTRDQTNDTFIWALNEPEEVKADEGSAPTPIESEGGAGQTGAENNAPAVEEQQATVRSGPRAVR
jgi:Serine dehydrogenase proteinase